MSENTGLADPATGTLQFDKAELLGQAATPECSGCKRSLAGTYFQINEQVVCPDCKEGVLAAVMERGADRFFAAIPTGETAEQQLAATARLQADHPDFLRLFYMLSLERSDDPAVTQVVRRVRDTAIARFRGGVSQLLPVDTPQREADRVVAEITAFGVALSDGIFFAEHLETDATDVERMYRRLYQTITAMIPILLEEK